MWYWVDYTDTSILPRNLEHKIDLTTKEETIELKTHNKEYPHCATIKKLKIYSAPTVAELGKALPNNLKDKNGKFLWLTSAMRSDRIWFIWYDNTLKKDIVNGIFYYRQTADTEANARGLMWEYLKKNGLIKEG